MAWRDGLLVFLHNDPGLQQYEVKHKPQLEVVPESSLDLSDLHLGEPVPAPQRKLKGMAAAGGNSTIEPMKIKAARELFRNTSQGCLHMDLDLTDIPQITYKTGDHLAVWPINPDQEVDRLMGVLGLGDRRAEPILIRALDPDVTRVPIPSPTTIETVLRYYLEICAPVPRDAIRAIAEFAPGEKSKDFLLRLGRDRDAYAQFVASNHVNVGRLLEFASRMGRDVGEMVLFFGCRRPDEDYLYADEFLTAEKELDGKKPGYVQDRVVEDGDDMVRMLLKEDASLYICGRASMAREVGQKLGQIMQKASEWDDAKAKEWAEGMKGKREWQEDLWG